MNFNNLPHNIIAIIGAHGGLRYRKNFLILSKTIQKALMDTEYTYFIHLSNIDRNIYFYYYTNKGHQFPISYLKHIYLDVGDNFLIKYVSKNGHLKMMEYLLKNTNVDPSTNNDNPIICASKHGHHEIVEILLKDKRVDPAGPCNEAIRKAARHGHDKIVEILLKDNRVDPSSSCNEAIRKAAFHGHDKVVEVLLTDPRVDVTDYSNEAFKKAVKNQHLEVIKILLKHNKIDSKDDYIKAKLGRYKMLHLLEGYMDDKDIIKHLLKNMHII